jgi:hypothetical protein
MRFRPPMSAGSTYSPKAMTTSMSAAPASRPACGARAGRPRRAFWPDSSSTRSPAVHQRARLSPFGLPLATPIDRGVEVPSSPGSREWFKAYRHGLKLGEASEHHAFGELFQEHKDLIADDMTMRIVGFHDDALGIRSSVVEMYLRLSFGRRLMTSRRRSRGPPDASAGCTLVARAALPPA